MWGDSCGNGDVAGSYGFNMDRGAELTMVNADIDIQKSGMREGSVPGEVDRIATLSCSGKQ